MITIKLYTILREKVGRSEIVVDAKNVDEAIKKLKSEFGEKVNDILFEASGRIKHYFILLLNGKTLERDKLRQYELKDGDVLHIFPPIAGG